MYFFLNIGCVQSVHSLMLPSFLISILTLSLLFFLSFDELFLYCDSMAMKSS